MLFGVLCLPGDQSHPFAQPTINPLACCICWAGLLGCTVFPPWNEGPNSGSYTIKMFPYFKYILLIVYLINDYINLLFITLYITYYKFSALSLPLIMSHKKHIIEFCYDFTLSGKIGHWILNPFILLQFLIYLSFTLLS